LVGVEGPHLVEAALEANLRIEAILVSTSGQRHLDVLRSLVPDGTRLLRTSESLFEKVAATETPQGIAALVHRREWTFEDLARGTPLIVILAGLQDPGNVGTIIRAAEGLGASGVVTCAAPPRPGFESVGTSNPLAPKALRASAGAALRIPLLHGAQSSALLLQLRMTKIQTLAACPAESPSSANRGNPAESLPALHKPWEVDWTVPSAIWIGNEGAGLPLEIVRSADGRVTIPHATTGPSAMESLNAGAAAAVLLYEAARQRGILA